MLRIGSHIESASWNIFGTFCGLFLLLNNEMQARFCRVSFQGRWKSHSLLVFGFTDFWRSPRYFSSIVISINFYHAEFEDRQPGILVDNFWGPKHMLHSRVSRRYGRAVLSLFFALTRVFAVFLFKVSSFVVLWIFMSIISTNFAEFAGIKLKIIRAR